MARASVALSGMTPGAGVPRLSSVTEALFRANFTASGFPTYNFTGNVDPGGTPEWSRAAVSGIGPGGEDVLRLTSLAQNNDGEFGWGVDKALTPPAQGTVWYIRWYQRWTLASDFLGHDGVTAVPYMNGKMMMLPDHGDVSGVRVSVNWESQHSPTTGLVKLYVGEAGGGRATGYILTRGTWAAYQLRVTPSSACGVTDGSLRIWINTDNASVPTQLTPDGTNWYDDSDLYNICNSAWDNARLGAYQNKGLQIAGTHAMEFAAFEIGTSFHPTWAADL